MQSPNKSTDVKLQYKLGETQTGRYLEKALYNLTFAISICIERSGGIELTERKPNTCNCTLRPTDGDKEGVF